MNAETEMASADGLGGEELTRADALAHLMRDGNLRVPCSRYGHDTETCAPVAYTAAAKYAEETGEPLTLDSLDYMMGLVVNDHDDVERFLPADPLDVLAEEIGYSDESDDDETGGVDALIDYKNALEERCRSLESTLGEIGHCLPKSESWDGGPGRLEDIAAILDRGLVERPNTSEYERH